MPQKSHTTIEDTFKTKEGHLAAIVRVNDEKLLDFDDVQGFRDELLNHIERCPGYECCLNMEGVEFLSAAALNKLIIADKEQKIKGYGGLSFASCKPEIQEVFVITRLNQLFNIYDSPEAYRSDREAK